MTIMTQYATMKKLLLFSGTLISLVLSGCAVSIPATDRTPPSFIFEITNGLPGGPVRIKSTDDLTRKQLNLRRNTLYRFRLSGTDAGGLGQLRLVVNWPTDFLELRPSGSEIATVSDGTTTRELIWYGNRSAPRSGFVISGQIHTILYNQSYAAVSVEWQFAASDFGGQAGDRNTVTRLLNVAIVDDTQELGWVDR